MDGILYVRIFILIFYAWKTNAQLCDIYPKVPLGMTDRANGITDNLIKASSQLNAQTAPKYGRLHFSEGFEFFYKQEGAGSWVALSQDRNQFIQMDLKERKVITGVATQGRKGSKEWVTDYYVQYTDDSESQNWAYYRDDYGSPYMFPGNIDAQSVKLNELKYPIVARYIRINPQRWNSLISMRVELYGCKYENYIASFDGNSRIDFRLDGPERGIQTAFDTIQFRFRTRSSNGLILYGDDGQGDYISLELYKGSFRVGLNLGPRPNAISTSDNSITAGSLLDDNQWHDVYIVRDQKLINVTVDRIKVWVVLDADFMHLNLNRNLSLGGLAVFSGRRGLLVQNNFTGCIENIWFDGLHIIRDYQAQMRDGAASQIKGFYGYGNPGSACSLRSIANEQVITFTTDDSYLKVSDRPTGSTFHAQCQFRTFHQGGTLIYNEVATDTFASVDLSSTDGQIVLQINIGGSNSQPILTRYKNVDPSSPDGSFADGLWHTVTLKVGTNQVVMTVDNVDYTTKQPLTFSAGPVSYFGGGRPGSLGFLGCMRNMMLQSTEVEYPQPDSNGQISPNARGVTLSGTIATGMCVIRDRCMPNPCKHNAKCSQNWYEFKCECSPTGYTGAVCHQSAHYTSCSELQLIYPMSAQLKTFIDLDGSGILGMINVTCDYTGPQVRTIVYHRDMEQDFHTVDGFEAPGSYSKVLDYYGASRESLAELVRRAVSCRQSITYKCQNARLLKQPYEGGTTSENRAYGWWVGRRGQPRYYWGGSAPGHQKCECGVRGNCQGNSRTCNCDAENEQTGEQIDTGFLEYKEDLPVTEVRFGDTGTPYDAKSARWSVGYLECFGDSLFDNTVTFRKPDASIELPPVYSETEFDINFLFKTTAMEGVFFQNTGRESRHFVEARIRRGRELRFTFDVGHGIRVLKMETAMSLNDNKWHSVRLERNRKEATLTVDNQEPVADPEPATEAFKFFKFDQSIFVGTTQAYTDGYVGCITNFMVLGVIQDLRGAVHRGEFKYGLDEGCVPRCASNPCLNRGECFEYYSHYYCECGLTPYRGYVCGREVGASMTVSSAKIRIELDSLAMGKIGTVDEYIMIGFKTRNKQGILMQIRNCESPSCSKTESIIVRINNAGGITVEINVGFEWNEVTTRELSAVDLSNDQHHTVIVYRTDNGKVVHIKIDDYPEMVRDFGKEGLDTDSDTRLDAPRIIYMGRNNTMSDSSGFLGCIYKAQFNNIFPLKIAFQEPAPVDSVVNLDPPGSIREDRCGYEEIMPLSELVEIRPHPTIPANLTSPDRLNQDDNGGIIAAVIVSIVILLCFLIIFCFCRAYSFERGDYDTNEAKGADFADDPDVAIKFGGGGQPEVKGEEWWL